MAERQMKSKERVTDDGEVYTAEREVNAMLDLAKQGAKMEDAKLTNDIKPREEWIDYLRGVGIILMFIGHTSVWSPIVNWIYGFHMPLFFMLSGFLLNKQKWYGIGYKKFLVSRFKNYIIPYFIWCGICFIINLPLLYYSYRHNNFPLAVIQNLGWIITSVKVDGVFLPQNCTALWFLTCLFLSQQVFYWLVKCRPVWQCVLSLVFIAMNYVMNYFKVPILPWHFEVSLVGSIIMLAGYYIREKQLIDKIKHIIVPASMIIISSAIIMLNGSKDIYYRSYGYDLIVFMVCSIMMGYSFMWICKSMNALYFKRVICKLGIYSIIAMGLNYSINRYARAVYQIADKLTGINMNWVEYPLTIINIAICLLAIFVYQKLVAKNKRFSILIGK